MNRGRPFSIVRRMMALVAGVSVVTVALYAFALVVVLRPFAADVAERLVGQIGSLERAMRAVPAAGREAFAATIRTDRVSIGRSPPVESLVEGNDTLSVPTGLRERIDAELGRRVQLITGPGVDHTFTVSVDLQVDGQTWWLTLGGVRPSIGWALVPIVGSVALIGIAAGLTLLVGVRLITDPMSRLAQELQSQRGALRRIDEPPRASIELQGVIRSFNAMVAAVEAADRSRHDLLAGASHDLRTPLARLRLRAEIECSPDVAARMESDFIAMSRIIDQFLAYAHGQGEPDDAPRYPLAEIVDAIIARYRDDGVDVGLAVAERSNAAFPETSVQRILGNLIDNACAYGREPIEVELVADDDDIGLTVFDAGPGIAPAAFRDALQPFVRLRPETAGAGHCGLGLAIVAQVAERLGGRMVLQPYDGRRSGVGVRLPRTSCAPRDAV